MKNTVQFLMALVLVATPAFADGFKCEGDDTSFAVKLYNQVQPELGTRNPAKLIISDAYGTLLVRTGGSIRKHNRANTTQYVVSGNQKLGAETAILQVAFKAGRDYLEAGEVAEGQLILVEEDGGREVYDLSCSRYKKQ